MRVEADFLRLVDGGRISVATNIRRGGDGGNAGTLEINATEVELIGTSSKEDPSGLFAQVCINRNCGTVTGNAGSVYLDIERLTVRDGAEITVSSKGTGNTGNLIFNVNRLFLDGGFLSATASELTEGNGGNIILNTAALGLWNGSAITTEAEALNDSDGGNIKIDTDTLIILDNSRINANAIGGNGGEIQIVTEGLLSNLDPERQITASSQLGIDGEVTINNSETHSSTGLLELPDTPIDVTALIGQDPCSMSRESELVATGRGGLPPTPREALRMEGVRVNPISLNPDAEPRPMTDISTGDRLSDTQDPSPTADSSTGDPLSDPQDPIRDRLVEAQGWVIGPNGEIILTAHPPTITPYSPGPRRKTCRLFD